TPALAPAPPAAAPVVAAKPTLDPDVAMQRLDSAVAAADLTDRGQVEALESLLAAGRKFSGAAFRGLNLSGATLSGHAFIDTDFTGADLTDVQFAGSNLEKAHLHFAQANALNAHDAHAMELRAPFLTAEQSSWRS